MKYRYVYNFYESSALGWLLTFTCESWSEARYFTRWYERHEITYMMKKERRYSL